MKSYTDLPQSKMLAEFLPLKSADAYYTVIDQGFFLEVKQGIEPSKDDIPCWSLAALFSMLPKSARLEKGKATELYRVSLPVELEASDWYINPVDACYEMIEKLHELNLL
jgi:hypothetical protein